MRGYQSFRGILLCAGFLSAALVICGCENSIFDPTPTTKTAAIDASGGSISFTDARGYSISINIPSGALKNVTAITVTSLGQKLDNPIGKNVFRGLTIEPKDLLLQEPATIEVGFPDAIPVTEGTCLYRAAGADLVMPLAGQEVDSSAGHITGGIYYFSQYAAGVPTEQEIIEQISRAKNASGFSSREPMISPASSGDCPPAGYGWQGTNATVRGFLYWSQRLQEMGNDGAAQGGLDAAEQTLQEDIESFLQQELPANPCGRYLKAASKYIEAAQALGLSLDDSDPMYQRYQQTIDQCALQFSIALEREEKQEEPAKLNMTSYGTATCYVPYTAFLAGGAAGIKGSGTLSYSYNYGYKPSDYMKKKTVEEATGVISVTCGGSMYGETDEHGETEHKLNVILKYKNNIAGKRCVTDADGTTSCETLTDTDESQETIEFPLQNGAKVGFEKTNPDTGVYAKWMNTLYIIHMPADDQDDSDQNCY